MKMIPCVCGIIVLFVMCQKQTDDNTTIKIPLLNGNKYILKVDRVIKNLPVDQFPSDNLQESDYTVITEHIQYEVIFSEDGQEVTIEPGSIGGKKINEDKDSKLYNLDKGLFAGGRFEVWIINDDFDAEYTIYGSGIPIVSSKRGKLELVRK
jgi:hypothetical protein